MGKELAIEITEEELVQPSFLEEELTYAFSERPLLETV
jgi:hypothetical protein